MNDQVHQFTSLSCMVSCNLKGLLAMCMYPMFTLTRLLALIGCTTIPSMSIKCRIHLWNNITHTKGALIVSYK